jgi:hypothetical protein
VCTWAPTPRIRRTFASIFPQTLRIAGDRILVGSREPLQLDHEAWILRAQQAAAYLGGPKVSDKVLRMLMEARLESAGEVQDVNRDLDPRDEFGIP